MQQVNFIMIPSKTLIYSDGWKQDTIYKYIIIASGNKRI